MLWSWLLSLVWIVIRLYYIRLDFLCWWGFWFVYLVKGCSFWYFWILFFWFCFFFSVRGLCWGGVVMMSLEYFVFNRVLLLKVESISYRFWELFWCVGKYGEVVDLGVVLDYFWGWFNFVIFGIVWDIEFIR